MNLLSLLGKKHVKDILLTLDKYGPLHLRQISKICNCYPGTLTKKLNELEKAGLVRTRDEHLPLRICEITDLGRKVLFLYELEEIIPHLENDEWIEYHIVSRKPEETPGGV